MALKVKICTFVVFVVFVVYPVQSVNDVWVYKNRLWVNNQEFIPRGVDYSPSPIGQQSMNGGTGYGGTGFCSAKLTPWGEYKSACYDSDYFDGSTDIDPTRFPNGFAPIWQRDIPNIVAMGANTIRLYNANPSTRAATQLYTNLYPYPTGKDHTQFMAYCAQSGIKVIFPLYSDDNGFANTDEATYMRLLKNHIDEVGGSPALLMWQLGNEAAWTWQSNSNWNNPATVAKFNLYANFIRSYTLSKWNRNIPVTIAIVNQASAFNFQMQNLQVDVFSANVFGDTFGSLFTGSGSFTGMTKLSCMYNRPFMITEFYRTWQPGQGYPTGDINLIYSNVVNAIKSSGLLGALYFEQTDEPALGKDFGAFGVQVAYNSQGNSTSVDNFLADAIYRKQQYTDLVSGTYNGKPYNMKTNIFSLLGRQPLTLSTSVANPCSSVGTYRSCPMTGYKMCSGNGVCDMTVGRCTCAQGWTGTSCNTPVCPGTPQCSNQGSCSTLVTPPECVCNAGYYGPSCSNTVSSVPAGTCPGLLSACSGNGLCNTTTSACTCWSGWVGADCAVHKI